MKNLYSAENIQSEAEDISNRPTRKGCCTKRAAALCLYLLFCQLFVQPCGDVPENLQLVGLHQQLVAGTGVEDAFNVLHTGVLQALDGAAHALALLAHRVGIAGEEEQRQLLGHPCQKSRVVQAQDAAEHTVIGVQRKGKGAALLGQILVHLSLIAVEPVVGGAAFQPLVVAHKGKVGHKAAAVVPAVEGCQHPAKGLGNLDQCLGLEAGAAFTAASRIDDFAYTPQQNIGHAMTTLMAQNRGAGEHERVKQGYHCGMRIEAAYGILIALAVHIFANPIMKMFVTDPEVIHLGVRFLQTVSLFYLMPAATNGIQGFFRGVGDLQVTLVSSTINMIGRVIAAAVFVLMWKMEIEALPYSYVVGWVLMLLYELPMLVRYLRSHENDL